VEIPDDMAENFWCFLIAELTPVFLDGGVNFLDFLMKGLNVRFLMQD
jgi:hypothetical protein